MKPVEPGLPASGAEKRIRRPPNGYIIFGREWRKKLATKYPTEGNTQISVRLGNMWHALTEEEKQKYLDLGRHTALEHRLRYPDYTYNPNEARMQKALRRAARNLKSMNPSGHQATTAHRVTLRQVHSHQNPALFRMLTKESMNYVKTPQSGDYVIVMDGQQVLSCVPALEITSLLSDSSGVGSGTENANSPVPAFEQASVSTEIGCYSHEVILSTATEETENHQSAGNKMLQKQDVHTSPCLQSRNHVSTPQSGDCMMLMDGQQLLSFLQARALEITSILSDSSGVGSGTENANNPVPAFEQASVSTEIGCYSHEAILSTATEETENHQSAGNKQNANKTKVEKNNLQREGELIDMKTDGPRITSAYSLKEIKLEQNIDEIQMEDSVRILNKEDSIRIKSEEICTPSAFSVDQNKPEISTDVVKVEPGLYNERSLASSCDGYEATGTKVHQISDIEDDDEPVLVIYSSVNAESKQNANKTKVEKYDLQREGDLADKKTGGLHIPSAFSLNKIKLEDLEETEQEITQNSVSPGLSAHSSVSNQYAELNISTGPISSYGCSFKRKRSLSASDQILVAVGDRLAQEKNEDKFDFFAKNVAAKLRALGNNEQRIYAEKLINDALFEAELGSLSRYSSINTDTGGYYIPGPQSNISSCSSRDDSMGHY